VIISFSFVAYLVVCGNRCVKLLLGCYSRSFPSCKCFKNIFRAHLAGQNGFVSRVNLENRLQTSLSIGQGIRTETFQCFFGHARNAKGVVSLRSTLAALRVLVKITACATAVCICVSLEGPSDDSDLRGARRAFCTSEKREGVEGKNNENNRVLNANVLEMRKYKKGLVSSAVLGC
jgi:hypothetical protein